LIHLTLKYGTKLQKYTSFNVADVTIII